MFLDLYLKGRRLHDRDQWSRLVLQPFKRDRQNILGALQTDPCGFRRDLEMLPCGAVEKVVDWAEKRQKRE